MLVLVVAAGTGGCGGTHCFDDKDYNEQGSGEATTAAGTNVLRYQPSTSAGQSDGPDPYLTFVPSSGGSFPSLTIVAPRTSGTHSLTDLIATACDTSGACTVAQGVLVYTLRPDLESDEFEADVSFYSEAPAGGSSAVTGAAQVTTTEDDDEECTDSGGFLQGLFNDNE